MPFSLVRSCLAAICQTQKKTHRNIQMKHSLITVAAASVLFAGIGVAAAQVETPATPSWTPAQSQTMITTYHSRHYSAYSDPAMQPRVGMVLPDTVQVYPLPDSMQGPAYSHYRYGMINDHPVVVESTTRKVVHTWN